MTTRGSFTELRKAAIDQGWTVQGRQCQWRFVSPKGEVFFIANHSSDPHGWYNARARLRRAGLKL